MRCLAYAKLNLALSVGPPLPAGDANAGMHPIASWMHSIDLCDEIEIAPLAEGRRSTYEIEWAADAPRRSPIDWPIEKDLAVGAHRLLEKHTGREMPVALRVTKRIPVGGGLGGGSSDAAAALLAINELFELGISLGQLRDLSRSLGSDVAYFMDEGAGEGSGRGAARPALVTGLGDGIERVPRSAAGVLLVLPPFGCPTGPVYKAFDALPRLGLREAEVRGFIGSGDVAAAALFNDLLPAAEVVRPELGLLRGRVAAAAGRPVLMSGSGSTLFILAPDGAGVTSLSAKIRAAAPEAGLIGTRLV